MVHMKKIIIDCLIEKWYVRDCSREVLSHTMLVDMSAMLIFFVSFCITALAHMLKTFFTTTPAHPHATLVQIFWTPKRSNAFIGP